VLVVDAALNACVLLRVGLAVRLEPRLLLGDLVLVARPPALSGSVGLLLTACAARRKVVGVELLAALHAQVVGLTVVVALLAALEPLRWQCRRERHETVSDDERAH